MGGNGGYGGKGGDGGSVFAAASTPSVTLQNVLVAQSGVGSGGTGGTGGLGNSSPSGLSASNGVAGAGPDLFGACTSLGHNYVQTNGGCSGFTNGNEGDIVNTNFFTSLGPLLNNGGRTLTCAMMSSTNRLVNAGDDSITGPPLNITVDQRGNPRLSGTHVDIGATELIWPTLPMVVNSCVSNNDGLVYITLTNLPNLRPVPVMETSTNPGGPWSPGTPLPEVAPGIYQVHRDPTSTPQQFYRMRTQ
jgi:hypothetical protein